MIDGTYRVLESGEHEVRFDRRIPQPMAKVWAALTDPAILKNWLGDVEIEPRVGGKFILDFRGQELMTGMITDFEPQRVLAFTWTESNTLPPSHVRWELSRDGEACRLVLMHRYPAGMARKDIMPFLAGWHAFLDVIGRGAAGEFVPYQDERALRDAYRAKYEEETRMNDAKGVFSKLDCVTFTRTLPGPIERVWSFIAETKNLPAWFGADSAIEPRAGGAVRLMGGHIRGVVTQWQPPKKLVYTWNVFDPADPPDAASANPESYPTFELEVRGGDVQLTFTHFPVLERFVPQNAMGWHTMLDILGASLRGEAVQERPAYMTKNAALYGVDLGNLVR